MKATDPGRSLGEWRCQRAMALVEQLDLLPSTVRTPMHLMALRRNPSSGAKDYADALAADAGLASKVIGLANSSLYSPAKPVTRLSQAVAMIGTNNLLMLVFGLSLSSLYSKLDVPKSEIDEMWRSSLLKSATARQLALLECPDEAEDAAIHAMLQDLALPVLQACDPSCWPEFIGLIACGQTATAERESSLYGHPHGWFGRKIAEKLGVPAPLCAAIEAHHDPQILTRLTGNEKLARCISLAAVLPHRSELFRPRCDGSIENTLYGNAAPTQAQHDRADKLMRDIHEQYRFLLGSTGRPDELGITFRQFMQEVAHEMAVCVNRSIETSAKQVQAFNQREAELNSDVQSLRKQVHESDLDPLTGVYTRRALENRLPRAFDLLRSGKTSGAVGFCDLDNFKPVNDRFGHPVGDAVLRRLAKCLREALDGKGYLSRFGGDEFVFFLRCGDPPALEQEMRELSATLNRLSIEVGPDRIPLSVSLGVVWVGVPDPCVTVDAVIASADQLMYRSKRAGKARVTVERYDPHARSAA